MFPGNKMMKAFVFKHYGRSARPEFTELPHPTVGPDEILVKVHAVGLNPIDNMIPQGTFKPLLKFELPAVLGSDLAGVVVEVGSRVTRFRPGDAVYANLFDLERGALAQWVVVPEHAAALKPASLDFVQAASIPMVALTAWQAFTEQAPLAPGQRVFIPAGSGGIGSFAMQLARHLGALVATSTSTANAEWVGQLGAEVVSTTNGRRSMRYCRVMIWCWAPCGEMRSSGRCRSSSQGGGSCRWSARRMRPLRGRET